MNRDDWLFYSLGGNRAMARIDQITYFCLSETLGCVDVAFHNGDAVTIPASEFFNQMPDWMSDTFLEQRNH